MANLNDLNMTDYEQERKKFKLDVPKYFNFGYDVVDRWAKLQPEKLALLAVDASGANPQHCTFSDISMASNRFANILKKLGLKKGDRVFLMLPPIPEWYVAVIGMIKLGVIPMPATTQCTSKDIEFRINQSESIMILTDGSNASKLEGIGGKCKSLKHVMLVRAEQAGGWLSYESEMAKISDGKAPVEKTRSDDPMMLYFTSGTVSYPKMVIHTQASYGIGHLITAKYWQDLKPADIHWTVSDMGWSKAAWSRLFGQWTIGATLFLHDTQGKFDPSITMDLLKRYGVTVFCAPPTVYRVLVLENLSRFKLDSLRHCLAAGEPLNPEVIYQWEKQTGLKIYDGYGQTETVNIVANYRCMPIKPGSMGKPTLGFDISIVDEDGNELPTKAEGHIAIKVKPTRPVGLFKEYWKVSEKTSDVFKGDWYYTGDKAFKDEDGYYWFVGRADDVIISSGYRIGPFEVESALIEHPAVAESAVVASPDDLRGEVVKAFVVLAPGYSASEELKKELQEHVKKVTAPYKYPRKIDFVNDLPKTISGKIKRGELKRHEWEGWQRK
ncbi:MAG TPA: AMP-binding protein [Dehalococcoidia bacterium]|nr:AMP-binding protein [Dehalococcoidia bacterium]